MFEGILSSVWPFAALLIVAVGLQALPRKQRRQQTGQPVDLSDVPMAPTPVLNRAEAAVHAELEALLGKAPGHFRLLAQVSMGEFIRIGRGPDAAAWRATFNRFNAKRVDFLIVDRDWQPILVVEYHGTGHNRGDASKRDAIKRQVLENAGIACVALDPAGVTKPAQARIFSTLGITPSIAAE